MKIVHTRVPEVYSVVPEIFEDKRGLLFESFRASWFPNITFVQDNHSRSTKGTLRGLHYQLTQPQGKLIRVISGEVFDVAIDLRKSSPTFLTWVGRKLSEANREIFWIPPGFAHGFLVLSESADLIYRCTNYYAPEDEHTILWNDQEIGIEWPIGKVGPILSEKDQLGKPLKLSPHFS